MHHLNPVYIFADGTHGNNSVRWTAHPTRRGSGAEHAVMAAVRVPRGWMLRQWQRHPVGPSGIWVGLLDVVFETRDAALAAAELLR